MSQAEALHARWASEGREHVVFGVAGIRCSSCAHSIEKAVRGVGNVHAVRVNGATARVSVDWTGDDRDTLPRILEAVSRAGFTPLPLAGDEAAAQYRREHRAALKRVGLASLGMMQAMMYLGALYGASDIDAAMAQLMRVSGMVIVTPVLFYSGLPFLLGAWRDLSARRLGMDVPVAFALLLAWVPSVVNTLRGGGEVYFDSVGMFIFFLSAGRFIEMGVRHRGVTASEALARSQPAEVTRLNDDNTRDRVAVTQLQPRDRFLVPKGGVVAVDAALADDDDAAALLDESLLSGESAPVRRIAGETIRGGSVNVGAPLTLRARRSAADSSLASMVALVERAQAERPRITRAADRMASWFVFVILLLAAATALGWWMVDASRAFGAVLAVLVVSCPCALSLATPAVLAAATTRLARSGLLVTRPDAIERLADVDTIVLDKTGTLTTAGAGIADVRLLGVHGRDEVLAIAAALERGSAHPVADAFRAHARDEVTATAIEEHTGFGIEGMVDGRRWRLGKRGFVESICRGGKLTALVPVHLADATMFLAGEHGMVAAIEVAAPLRDDARHAADELRRLGLGIVIASGDNEAAVRLVARELGIQQAHARLSPDDKIWLAEQLRRGGHRVFVIGDGINDGPVLAAADVSCAMGLGSSIAQSAADLLLVHESLAVLPRAVQTARRARRTMRQNLRWALAYNLAAVPLAALGLVPAWLAALGMSLSSLGVVLNARRLLRPERGA